MSEVREHAEWRERATLAALGALDEEERSGFARHLGEGCAECLGALREAEATLAALAVLAASEPVPARLRTRVLSSCADGAPEREPARVRTRAPAPAPPPARSRWLRGAARVAAAAALALLAWRAAGTFERERMLRHQAEVELARVGSLAQAAERERDRLISLVETVGAPAARAVILAGSPDVPGAGGRAFVESVGQRIVLLVHDLPPPPPGRPHQPWPI